MNKRQARLFAIGCTAAATVVFIALTIDSHRQFPKLTNAQNITPEVTRGKDVWHVNNCINCHTLFGEGAYYAPDLTKITQHRGAAYLQAYMRDPAQFYDENKHRRLMPRQDLSERDITDLIAFLDWVSKVDNAGWPPRPILVTGATFPGTDRPLDPDATTAPAARPVEQSSNPIALGERVFRSAQPACSSCHSIVAGVNMAGPSLAGSSERAETTLKSGDYKGEAKDVEGYLREAITHPSAHIAAGGMYGANGVSFMPATYRDSLSQEQIDQVVAYLMTLK
jgi:nitric oxide reductase subunit C